MLSRTDIMAQERICCFRGLHRYRIIERLQNNLKPHKLLNVVLYYYVLRNGTSKPRLGIVHKGRPRQLLRQEKFNRHRFGSRRFLQFVMGPRGRFLDFRDAENSERRPVIIF